MRDGDAIQMMRRCSEEIKTLRREIERLSPLADAYESVRTVLNLIPERQRGHSEDLAWRLDREIEKLEAGEPSTVEANN